MKITIGENEYEEPILRRGRTFIDYNGKSVSHEDMLYLANSYTPMQQSIEELGKQGAKHINELALLRQERDDLLKRVEELIEFADDCLLCANGLIGANSTKEHESYESNFNELIVKAASLRLPSFKESPDEN